jgi:hypothetical protein
VNGFTGVNRSESWVPLLAAGLVVRDFAGWVSFAFRRALVGRRGLGAGRSARGPGEGNGNGPEVLGETGFTSGNCSMDARSIRRLLGVRLSATEVRSERANASPEESRKPRRYSRWDCKLQLVLAVDSVSSRL